MTERRDFHLSRIPFWAASVWRTMIAGVAAYLAVEGYALASGSLALPEVADPTLLAGCAVAAYGLVEIVAAQVRARASSVTVDGDRILFSTGYVSTATRSLWIAEVTGIDTAKTLVARMGGYGDVTVEARGMDAVTVRGMADADGFVSLVRSLKDDATRDLGGLVR